MPTRTSNDSDLTPPLDKEPELLAMPDCMWGSVGWYLAGAVLSVVTLVLAIYL